MWITKPLVPDAGCVGVLRVQVHTHDQRVDAYTGKRWNRVLDTSGDTEEMNYYCSYTSDFSEYGWETDSDSDSDFSDE